MSELCSTCPRVIFCAESVVRLGAAIKGQRVIARNAEAEEIDARLERVKASVEFEMGQGSADNLAMLEPIGSAEETIRETQQMTAQLERAKAIEEEHLKELAAGCDNPHKFLAGLLQSLGVEACGSSFEPRHP